SGRTAVSSLGMTMPETSTMAEKQDFAALNTVTAAPLGPSLGASGYSGAARHCCEARVNKPASTGVNSFRESSRAGKWFIGLSVRFPLSSLRTQAPHTPCAIGLGGERRGLSHIIT